MLDAGGDERRLTFLELDRLARELEHAAALEHEIDLVVLVRLLTVWLGRHQHVHPKLEPRRLVYELVAAVCGCQATLGGADVEGGHGRER
jgi:hypothetical protein